MPYIKGHRYETELTIGNVKPSSFIRASTSGCKWPVISLSQSDLLVVIPISFVNSPVAVAILSIPSSHVLMQTAQVTITVVVCEFSTNWFVFSVKASETISWMRVRIAFYFLKIGSCSTFENISVAILYEWLALDNLSVPAACDSYPIILKTTLPSSFTLLPNPHKLRSAWINNNPVTMPFSVLPVPRVNFTSGIPANTLAMPLIILKIPLINDVSMQQAISF